MLVYIVTNTVNLKRYVGITKGSLRRRLNAHLNVAKKSADNIHFYNAIRKYGAEAFIIEQIDSASSVKELAVLEKKYIAEYKTKTPNGYNMTDGGEGISGYQRTPEQRAAHAEKMKAYHARQTPEQKALKAKNISEAKKGVPNLKLRGNQNARGAVRDITFRENASAKQSAFAKDNPDEMARRGGIRHQKLR